MNRSLACAATAFALATSLGADARSADGPAPLPSGALERIAFGSRAKHWQYQPIWESALAADPDLWIYLGDAIYADTDGHTAWEVSPPARAQNPGSPRLR